MEPIHFGLIRIKDLLLSYKRIADAFSFSAHIAKYVGIG
jgi:hypothetical protein